MITVWLLSQFCTVVNSFCFFSYFLHDIISPHNRIEFQGRNNELCSQVILLFEIWICFCDVEDLGSTIYSHDSLGPPDEVFSFSNSFAPSLELSANFVSVTYHDWTYVLIILLAQVKQIVVFTEKILNESTVIVLKPLISDCLWIFIIVLYFRSISSGFSICSFLLRSI